MTSKKKQQDVASSSYQQHSRRTFLKASAALGAGTVAGVFLGLPAWSAEGARRGLRIEKVNFACIGVGGKGTSDSNDAGRLGNVVAICDIDEKSLENAAARFPDARKFIDFREMLEAMGDEVDAVTVSTADHTHAHAALRAMRMGKHCFCQKPLTHSIHEARLMGETAREYGVQSQMGNQGTAASGLRRGAALVRSGAIGPVKEVHVWTNRPVWPQGCERPPLREAPAHVRWDLWLGPAPQRSDGLWEEKIGWGPRDGYHPFNWRGWWDFGTGALGDMACHTMNLPFMALDLRDPTSVEAETSAHNRDSYPSWSKIRYEFPGRNDRAALTLHWYDGGKTPDATLFGGETPASSGSLMIGERGSMYSPGDNGNEYRLLGDASEPDVEIEESPGHFEELVRAIESGKPAVSNFPDYAGPLTETVLLGNLAVWAGARVEWDSMRLKATCDAMDVADVVTKKYPQGWEL